MQHCNKLVPDSDQSKLTIGVKTPLLESGDSFRCSWLVEASHVLMHLWKTLLHVVLGAALPHCPKTKTP